MITRADTTAYPTLLTIMAGVTGAASTHGRTHRSIFLLALLAVSSRVCRNKCHSRTCLLPVGLS